MGRGFHITAKSPNPTTTLTPYMGRNPVEVHSGDGVTVVQTRDGTPILLRVANAPYNPDGSAIIDPIRIAYHHGVAAIALNPSRGALGSFTLPSLSADDTTLGTQEFNLPFGPSPRGDITLDWT